MFETFSLIVVSIIFLCDDYSQQSTTTAALTTGEMKQKMMVRHVEETAHFNKLQFSLSMGLLS